MDNIILGTFGTLYLSQLQDNGNINKIIDLSTVSCVYHQIKYENIVKLAFLKSINEIEILSFTSLNDYTSILIKIQDNPISFQLSPKGNFVTVIYRTYYSVLDLSGNSILSDLKIIDIKHVGQFNSNEEQFTFQDEIYIKSLNLITEETEIVHTAIPPQQGTDKKPTQQPRLIQITYCKDVLVIASAYISQQDPGYIRVYKNQCEIIKKILQKADSFVFLNSKLHSWFIATVKVEIDRNSKQYNYYGTRQLFLFDLISFKQTNLSLQSQQVHGLDTMLISPTIEHLFYIIDKIPTQIKMAELKTTQNAVAITDLSLSYKTNINSLTLGKNQFIIRGEAGMDGICYSCRIGPGKLLDQQIQISGKEKILYKTHCQFSSNDMFLLMGTLAPRLNVDNGISVRGLDLKEIWSIEIPKLQVMTLLRRGDDWGIQNVAVCVAQENLNIENAKAVQKNVYVPQGMLAHQEAAKTDKGESKTVSLF
ncbi:Eukaryotic translation initiation factor eIF2A [Spironucleus salmonicida]|uniref:Eukaryotic translation initiation factor eIF2A n=1 Tax=Spironucleus salmonicida TaxID=348837 RepID=V6LYY4_9EUKA|nr:Eukaryotic translation initiation factor eIF2A [Spironucleus salmonicida]|eukprot:EST46044.1 EIF2A domain-containing protein [Spironucleus salmonicida]